MEGLHIQIDQVFSKQLEKQLTSIRNSLRQECKRNERLTSQLHLTRHQQSLYLSEIKQIQHSLKLITNSLTKEQFFELRNIKSPVSSLLDLCDKFLLILDIKDRSWKSFRSISKNFPAFKNLMSSIQTEDLPESSINEVLPLWKNQSIIRAKLRKFNSGAVNLLDWLSLVVELNVKNEIIGTSRKRIPELEKMIRHQEKVINDLEVEAKSIEELIGRAKGSLDDEKFDCEDCSELSITSKPYSFVIVEPEDKYVFHNTVHRGTASGGIMKQSFNIKKDDQEVKNLFPNFNSESLYGEIPVDKGVELDEPILFEGKKEMVGCCRMKFFCF